MKFILLVLMTASLSIAGHAQRRQDAILPDVGDVSSITFIDGSPVFYTSATLLAKLSQLMLSPDKTRDPRGRYQSGTFELKDGSSVRWFAGDDKSLYIQTKTEMKYFAVPTDAEISEFLTLPTAENVEKIFITNAGGNWYTPESLLKALPNFIAGGGYKTKMLWQQGVIKLKTGQVLMWKAYSRDTLVLYFRHGEKYFELKKDR